MSNRIAVRFNSAKKAALAVAVTAALEIPIAIRILNAPMSRAETSSSAQSTPVSWPKFEVASIKPCKAGDITSGEGRGSEGGGGRVRGDPGRLRLECQTVESLIRSAYLEFANGKPWPVDSKTGMRVPPVSLRLLHQPIQGSHSWIKSERYTIEAEPESAQTMAMMRGPMLQALLEDRFKLKIHRETRAVPIYALVVAKGGPKLRATKEGSCTFVDWTKGPPPPPQPGQPPGCGFFSFKNGEIDTYGQTMTGLCRQFSAALDRDVVDKTGITGAFDIHLELTSADLLPFDRPDGTPDVSDPAATQIPPDPPGAITHAVQKLGLKLVSAKGAGEFLVIDHVERPSNN
jgi:uncharacterized protein (TIGR03435 family)